MILEEIVPRVVEVKVGGSFIRPISTMGLLMEKGATDGTRESQQGDP